eukprot:gene12176-15296_t
MLSHPHLNRCAARSVAAKALPKTRQTSHATFPHSTLPEQMVSAVLSTTVAVALMCAPAFSAGAEEGVEEFVKYKSISEMGQVGMNQQLDADKDGMISREELVAAGKKMADAEGAEAPTDEEITAAMLQYDLNLDGKFFLG